jgi:hypothetical protein
MDLLANLRNYAATLCVLLHADDVCLLQSPLQRMHRFKTGFVTRKHTRNCKATSKREKRMFKGPA